MFPFLGTIDGLGHVDALYVPFPWYIDGLGHVVGFYFTFSMRIDATGYIRGINCQRPLIIGNLRLIDDRFLYMVSRIQRHFRIELSTCSLCFTTFSLFLLLRARIFPLRYQTSSNPSYLARKMFILRNSTSFPPQHKMPHITWGTLLAIVIPLLHFVFLQPRNPLKHCWMAVPEYFHKQRRIYLAQPSL